MKFEETKPFEMGLFKEKKSSDTFSAKISPNSRTQLHEKTRGADIDLTCTSGTSSPDPDMASWFDLIPQQDYLWPQPVISKERIFTVEESAK